MFGHDEHNFNLYIEEVEGYTKEYVCTGIVDNAKYLVGLLEESDNGKAKVNTLQLQDIIKDVQNVIGRISLRIAYDYVYLRSEAENERQVIEQLHNKYEFLLINELINNCISFTEDVISNVIVEIIMQLPLIYNDIFEGGENLDELEDKMNAYDDYIAENINIEDFYTEDGEDSSTWQEIDISEISEEKYNELLDLLNDIEEDDDSDE